MRARIGIVGAMLAVACGGDGDPAADAGSTTDGSSSGADDTAGTTGDGATDGSTDGAETGGETDGPPGPPAYEPALYEPDRVHSPVTAFVADRIRDITDADPTLADDVFMKVGASSTVSPSTLFCFAGAEFDLGEHAALQPALDHFLGGDAGGSTPFDRVTLAAQSGRNAGWAITGDPSPLTAEADALSPQLALVHYGTNDMQLGIHPGTALPGFYDNMMELLDTLEGRGIVPVVFGITRRADDDAANRWVATYNAAIRGMAQTRQVPHIDLFNATDALPGHGLSPDGIHLEAFAGGACVLTMHGLEHGYNMRNLVALQALDRAKAVLVDDVDEIETSAPTVEGDGRTDDPVIIDVLPFADGRDTAIDGLAEVDRYAGCDDTIDESGPEVWYRLELTEPTPLRAVVLDRAGVDIDIHIVDDTAMAGGCLARDDTMVEGTVGPGVVHVALDTWSGAGEPFAGAYTMVVLRCDDDDPRCATPL